MKKFLLHTSLWGGILITVFASVIVYHAGPRTDFFYNRFTRHKAPNLILGSSRAAQGINPSEIQLDQGRRLFNFAFTNYNSPYGNCYLDAVKRKFSKEKGGLFILEVNPFVLSNYRKNMIAAGEVFEECSASPSNMWTVNTDPNFEYFLRNYSDDFRTLTGIKPRPYATFLHDNGWLEIEMAFDTAYFRENTEEKVKNYNELIKKMKPSPARWKALEETVSYFKTFGEVYLVRIPVSPQMEEIERRYYPDFRPKSTAFSERLNVPYLDYFYLNDSLYFTDGNHLHRESAKEFSSILGKDIRRRE